MSKIALRPHIYSILFFIATSFTTAAETSLLVVTDLWPPYAIEDNGEYKGTDVDIIIATFKRMGIPIRLEFYPWKRCLAMIEQKQADAILTAAKTSERQKIMYFPEEPVSRGMTVFFIKKGKNIPYQNLQDLDHLRAGAVTGYKYCDVVDKTRFVINAERVVTIEQNFKKLLAGRLDFSVGDQAVGFYKAKVMGILNDIDIIPGAYHCPGGNFLAFSKKAGHDKIASQFGATILKFKNTKQYGDILKYYGMSTH